MRLIQFLNEANETCVGRVTADGIRVISGTDSIRTLALHAWSSGKSLAELATTDEALLDYQEIIDQGRLLAPVHHPDAAHCLVSGTGLTHLGSAAARDAMHQCLAAAETTPLTDSMKMFQAGLDGGKPADGGPGVQPEWFYKGDGAVIVPPEGDLEMPAFAMDGGEEPEIAAIYLIAPDGTPLRLGFALGNEFSDHVMERRNYLYLAHSKLRACSIGPELRIGPLPDHLAGTSRIRRGGAVVWEKSFLTGEANMCHSLANLEYHHFKYRRFRRPGDLHIHFLGTAALSFSDGVTPREGDRFEIAIPEFGRPLRNRLMRRGSDPAPRIQPL